MAKNKYINLLPQEEFDASLLGRSLKWAMSSFRTIVILTEMIVMAAFLSRFWLDAQNADLDSSIKVSAMQISAQGDFEKEFRGVQKKLSIYKQITSIPIASGKIDLVALKIPSEIILSSITTKDNTTQIKGSSGSEFSVAQFISNLKSDPSIKRVDLVSIGSSDLNPSMVTFLIDVANK